MAEDVAVDKLVREILDRRTKAAKTREILGLKPLPVENGPPEKPSEGPKLVKDDAKETEAA